MVWEAVLFKAQKAGVYSKPQECGKPPRARRTGHKAAYKLVRSTARGGIVGRDFFADVPQVLPGSSSGGLSQLLA
jgi:hypothetical protein